jgi:hypothetical protein
MKSFPSPNTSGIPNIFYDETQFKLRIDQISEQVRFNSYDVDFSAVLLRQNKQKPKQTNSMV